MRVVFVGAGNLARRCKSTAEKKAKQSHKKHKDSSFELSFVYANYFSISPSESALR